MKDMLSLVVDVTEGYCSLSDRETIFEYLGHLCVECVGLAFSTIEFLLLPNLRKC